MGRLKMSISFVPGLCYILLSMPLGIIYFVLLVVGITTGISTLIVWIGIPLLYLTFLLCWNLANFESVLARTWLQVAIPPFPPLLLRPDWAGVRQHLSQRITWKALAYLLVKFPFSIFVFPLAVASLAFTIVLSALALVLSLVTCPFFLLWSIFIPGQHRAMVRYGGLVRGGFVLALVPLYIPYGVNELWGQFARTMLSVDERERELMQARALIEQERARAERAEQQRRELIANLSHDLRTPVANIRGHAEALLKQAEEEGSISAPQQAYLTIIHREAIRLGSLFDELLSLIRTETHELHFSITAVDIGEVVEEVYQIIMPLARRERRIAMTRNIAAGLPPARVDRQRLQQVLLNLVRNAIAYTPAGGLVAITLQRADNNHLVLAVADTGVGIAPEDQARIFERFYRTDSSRTRTTGGFGLGLAIVQELVEAMGGSVRVESMPGEGSCFSIVLPVA
jgi:signal transduction histidine kinase